MSIENCPWCENDNCSFLLGAENREYIKCTNCDIVFVPKKFFVSKQEEKAKYDNHQNSPTNKGYKEFLNRLLTPLCTLIPKNSHGLDFGSGPGPTLSILMTDNGYNMDIYDYFYHNEPQVFEKKYDFITSTEVIEHLHNPYQEITKLWSMLNENGVLGIMTAFRPDDEEFKTWYYKRDLTHVRFFTKNSFLWLCEKLEADIIIPQDGVVILKKRKHG